jgi:cytochrome c-type biogenesis protein CcmE
MMRNKLVLKIIITLGLVGVAVSLLAMSGSGSAALYKHIDEVALHPKDFMGKSLKIHGHVVPGTVRTQIIEQSTHYFFDLEWKGQVLSVEQVGGEFPDTVKDNSEVVATGRLADATHFRSTELSAKCASKYKKESGGGM